MWSAMQETGFFATWGGSWDTPYGRFFLDWYHKSLLSHGERLLQAITSVFHTQHPRRCTLSNHFDSTQSIVATGVISNCTLPKRSKPVTTLTLS